MIHTFTISFDFKGKTYLALASIRTGRNPEKQCTVHIYNTSLYRIFPNGMLTYSDNGVECPAKLTHPLTRPLLDSITVSVDAHLRLAQQYE